MKNQPPLRLPAAYDKKYILERIAIDPDTGCWNWTLWKDKNGYGRCIKRLCGFHLIHRLAYNLWVGPPGNLFVCHKCDNPSCCNPEHLFLGTNLDNIRDAIRKGRPFNRPPNKGEDNPAAKFTEADIRLIRQSTGTLLMIAKKFGTIISNISQIKNRRAWKHIATVLLMALLPFCVSGQVIQLVPSSYHLTIRSQNNIGKYWATWMDETRDTVTLSNRVLTFTHTVLFSGVSFSGSRWGGPKLLEDTLRYRQIGGASYVPIGGEEITWLAPRVGGGWIAATNFVPAVAMAPIFWLPGLVGEFEAGDKFRRTVTTGSALVMSGRNLQNAAYLLRVPCEPDFCFAFAFKANERKEITLSMDTVSWFSNGDLQGFTVNLEDCWDEAL